MDLQKPYADDNARFDIEATKNKEGEALFYILTPLNYSAYDWAEENLSKRSRWGTGFLLNTYRGGKLPGHLKYKHGYEVNVK